MAKFTPYALGALPANGIDVNGLYFIKSASSTSFNIYIRKGDNSDWVTLGTVDSVDSVNGLTGGVTVDLQLQDGKLSIVTGGAGTPTMVTEINLDAEYRKLGEDINWAEITGVPNFALDNVVVKTSGNQTVAGTKTFSTYPVLPTAMPTTDRQAAPKKYVDDADAGLQTQIDALEVIVDSGMRVPQPLDCSSNPNYPAGTKGDQWRVTAAGRIGGANGEVVEVNDTIICIIDSAGGTQAAVGDNYYISQANVDQATETLMGIARVATQALVSAGEDDKAFITSLKLAKRLEDFEIETQLNWGADGKEW